MIPKVAERIQSSRIEDGVSTVLTADGQVRFGTFCNQNYIHIGHSFIGRLFVIAQNRRIYVFAV